MAIRSTIANPQPEPAGGCYHILVCADGGDAWFRRKRCYTRAGANAAIKQWCTYGYGGGDRPGNLPASPAAIKAATMVIRCRPGCACGHSHGLDG